MTTFLTNVSAADVGSARAARVSERNLGLLQELIRKDAESYRDEFVVQMEHYRHTVRLLALQPAQHRLDVQPLLELLGFLAHTAPCYPKEARQLADSIVSLLREQAPALDAHVRQAFCKALVALRNKGAVDVLTVLTLFFELVKLPDRALRKFVLASITTHIKRLAKKRGGHNTKALNELQNFILARLNDSRSIVARAAQLLLIDAFRRKHWRDAKTANAIAGSCFHAIGKIQVAAMKFFLGSKAEDDNELEESESDSENEGGKKPQKTIKEVMTAFRHTKKTKKRKKELEQAKKAISKDKKAKKEGRSKECNLAALHLLYDPQSFADQLFEKLEQKRVDRFEIRILRIALCARIIGIHRLQTLGFYSYLHRFLHTKQREVTRILLYAAWACHPLVPPDVVEQLVRVIAQNFVTDRNSNEAITVGINAIREVFTQSPAAATPELLKDLTEYKTFKNKNVSMAARSLITLFREINPSMLAKKDRGRVANENRKEVEIETYGGGRAVTHIEGAEVLDVDEKEGEEEEMDDDASEGDDDEDLELEISDDDDDDEEEGDEDEENLVEGDDEEGDDDEVEEGDQSMGGDDHQKKEVSTVEKAKLVSSTRILTQEDFRQIRVQQLKKKLVGSRRLAKSEEKRRNDDEKLEEELKEKLERMEEGGSSGLTRLADIELFHKKINRSTKAERQATVEAGREGRQEFGAKAKRQKGGDHAGKTNRTKEKKKAFGMIKNKVRGKNRQRSFRDQQMSLRNYLMRQAGRKPGNL